MAFPNFNALHSGKHNREIQFCALDVLASDGDDLSGLPLMRKTHYVCCPAALTASLSTLSISARSNWVKVKNVTHPSIGHIMERRQCQ